MHSIKKSVNKWCRAEVEENWLYEREKAKRWHMIDDDSLLKMWSHWVERLSRFSLFVETFSVHPVDACCNFRFNLPPRGDLFNSISVMSSLLWIVITFSLFFIASVVILRAEVCWEMERMENLKKFPRFPSNIKDKPKIDCPSPRTVSVRLRLFLYVFLFMLQQQFVLLR